MMDLSPSLSIDALKDQAKRLRQDYQAQGTPIGHGRALELTARKYHFKDWNTLQAAVKKRARPLALAVGEMVRGRYLGQPFTGKVLDFYKLPEKGAYRLTLLLETPVDVVRFDSFSAYRKRIVAIIGDDGATMAQTSDGNPQLSLDL